VGFFPTALATWASVSFFANRFALIVADAFFASMVASLSRLRVTR
jgi:hypothetical protein